MKYLLVKEKNKRKKINFNEYNRIVFLSILKNTKININFRQNLYLLYKYKFFYPFKTQIKNRCIFTNKSRSVFYKFRLSRILLKYFIIFSKINGLRKISW